MSLPAHLFEQANHLATWDARRPRQANLRRAVSAAYYALFHLLVSEATATQVGAGAGLAGQRRALARAFVHGTIADACRSFSGGVLKASIARGLGFGSPGTEAVHSEIRQVAETFVELQELRHLADYDLLERFVRHVVVERIADARRRGEAFVALPPGDQKRFFLTCLLAWREVAGRR